MVAQEVVLPAQDVQLLVGLTLLMELAHPVELIPPVVVVTEATFVFSNTVQLLHCYRFSPVDNLSAWARECVPGAQM